jgi:hypothetical protein
MKRMMIVVVVVVVTSALVICTGGCTSYTRVQMDLVEQARKGLALIALSHESRQQVIDELHITRRRQLDEAFDADVRDVGDQLTIDWVIEHRRAYAAGIDALAGARNVSREAADIERSNLAATDEALRRLYWLQSLHMQWMSLIPEESR